MTIEEGDLLLNAATVASLMGVAVGTVHQLVHQKRIPHVRFGPRFVRFRRDVIERWIREHDVAASR